MTFRNHYDRGQNTNDSKLTSGIPGGSVVKNLLVNAGDTGSIPSQEDPLEKKTATHTSILAWEIPWTEEPGRLQFMVSQRIGHDLVTASACNAGEPGSIPGSGRSPGEGNGNPLQYSCLENPMDRGA